MSNNFIDTLFIFISQFNLILSLSVFTVSLLIQLYCWYFNLQVLIKNYSPFLVTKYLLLISLTITITLQMLLTYIYIYSFKLGVNTSLFLCEATYTSRITPFCLLGLKFNVDLTGILFADLAFIVSFLSLLVLDTRIYHNNIKFISVCNLLAVVIHVYTMTNNYLIFFIMYELLLIPSFLFVYFVSPGKKAIQASIYFVIWTQIGSFLVLMAISYLLITTKGTYFNNLRDFNFTKNESYVLLYLFFFGFGFKVPLWPFHYWITKTHVEAPTGFSMFLSGFLVKSAILGYFRFSSVIGINVDTTLLSCFAIIGVIDASLKMWGQTDLKKLVAYATIQEMGLIYLTFCWGDSSLTYAGVFFSVTHAFLSCLFFYFVDCINRRFGSRNIVEVNGVMHSSPNLGIAVLIGCILFSGLPGTMKFVSELYIFMGLLQIAPLSLIIIILSANFFGIIGFCKVWFNAIFGMSSKSMNSLPKDLVYKEIYIILYCFLFLVAISCVLPLAF